jgi:hypothetical protein
MCCVALILGFFGPRFAFAAVWIFDNSRVSMAMGSAFWLPLAGLIFLPWTALAWVLCYAPIIGVSGFGYFVVALGFFFDLATWSGRFAQNRYQGSGTSATV